MTTRIPLSQGMFALVDDCDAAAVRAAGPWHVRKNKRRPNTMYAGRNVRRPDGVFTSQMLHQFISGQRGIDHVNRDGLDNRRCNLRSATGSQNAANRAMRPNNTSGYRGVVQTRHGRWRAQIRVDTKFQYLGTYDTPEQAARAYDSAAVAAWGEFAQPNFPTTKEILDHV